ncbi:protein strawberry notch homolog 1-like isoform X2 [Physella acuta]|uniref:protein strawberry notch homolog 1-like isoform X2 n=1 Tax=Physella acuta TaxID=109671 RepID=UPI0027DC8985|nr:protein strawberry notch homolog 1-like isoform X2 [Physella acuta]
MNTESPSGEAFPDLISAALRGAGISGDDLAFDFSDFDDGTQDESYGLEAQSQEVGQALSQNIQISSGHQLGIHNANSTNVMRQVVGHNQQNLQQSAIQASQPMTVVNPPHIRPQQTILSAQMIRSQNQQGAPQGMQSFRIIRTPTSVIRTQTVQPTLQQQKIRCQPVPRHLLPPTVVHQVSSPQVIGTSILSNNSATFDASTNRNIIRIPASSMANGMPQGQQLVIQSQNGPSQVLKVTTRGGKAVSTEDITKIVSSLPNLKNGSRIIVNTTPGALGESKATIHVVSKPPTPPTTQQLQPIVFSAQSLQKNPNSLIMPNPIISTLKTAQGIQSSAQSLTNTKISKLPFTPTQKNPVNVKLGQMGTLSSMQAPLSNIPTVTDMTNVAGPHLRMSMSSKDLSKTWSDHQAIRRVHSAQNLQRGLSQVPQDEEEIEEEVEELGHAETYAEYKPSKLNFGKKHPDPVVETSSLSSVEPPDVKYQLRILDEGVDEDGKLSALQLEAITYACQKHEMILPGGQRAGYLIGDGAGVGKGRTIAGIIFENYLKRRKRALWLSVSNDLKVDAERDLRDIGANHIEVYPLNKFKYYAKLSSKENGSCKKGVVFATYSSLIGESQAEGKYNTRMKQLLKWFGSNFDGVIIFDECHKAKNLCPTGSSKPTKTGQTVLELQNRLPLARVVYASATGATEPRNMAYMTRLGLWGKGTPFNEFNDFIQAVERRGVGAMELVAMDAKLRGMYIARQLSFHGVTFRIDEIPLEKDFVKVYNLAVEMWVEAREMFQKAAELIEAEHRMKKSMWGQFWSAHQRFFKYLCISSKVNHCVDLARDAVKCGKCVVIGLQSTGEARTLEQVEEAGGDLTDFVSTAKGVFQSLVERHFPASTRGRAMDIIKQVSNSHKQKQKDSPNSWKKNSDEPPNKRQKRNNDDSSDPESNDSSPDISDIDYMSSSESESDSDDEERNPFANGWDSDDDDPWCQKKRKKKESPKKKKREKKKKKDKDSKKNASDDEDAVFDKALAKAGLLNKTSTNGFDGHSGNWEKASAMKSELLARIEYLGEKLPPNTLDQLIDDLGGPESVAEMTGRKSRVVSTTDGVQFESRSEADVSLEILNLTEKQRFMDGEKFIAIISEAASSGISLQADRRAINQRRRVHITLELPWSADRAIQQFGRSHRSNQVSAPEYVFLISELAGERRFASTVAKRLESLGALTHGDRRATETRDLSRFNIDNKYGRMALETVMKSVLDIPCDIQAVSPPKNYQGDFFKDVKEALIGVGMISVDEKTGAAVLEKDFNNISKFLNRILGMKVAVQNALFKYFTENLTSIILEAKRNGRWDMGIMDLGSGQEKVRKIETKVFVGNTLTNTAKTELTKFAVERGMHWQQAIELWRRCGSMDEGFYCSLQDRMCKKTVVLVVIHGKNKKKELMYNVYRPNTGLQSRPETLEEIKKKFKKCLPDVAEPLWEDQYAFSETQCSHKYLRGSCRKAATGQQCDFGLRTRFYHVLSGSVLSVWSKVESVLVGLSATSRMQIIRLRTEDNQRIVGSLIPPNAVTALERTLSQDSGKTYTEKHDNPFNYQPYIPGSNSSHYNLTNNQSFNVSTTASTSNNFSSEVNDNNNSSNERAEENEPPELLSMPTLVW